MANSLAEDFASVMSLSAPTPQSAPAATVPQSGNLAEDFAGVMSLSLTPQQIDAPRPLRKQYVAPEMGALDIAGTVGGVVADEASSLARGAISGLGSLAEGVPVLAKLGYDKAQSLLTGGRSDMDMTLDPFKMMEPQDTLLYRMGKGIREFAEKTFPKAATAGSVDRFISQDVPEAVGQTATLLLAGGGPAAIGVTAATQTAGSSYDEATAAGLEGADRDNYVAINSIVAGATEPVPFSKFGRQIMESSPAVKRLLGNRILEALSKNAVRRAAVGTAEQAIEEGGQEFVQGLTQKITLESAKNKERPLGEIAVEALADPDLWKQAAVGGVVGGIFGAGGEVLSARRQDSMDGAALGRAWAAGQPELADQISVRSKLSRSDYERLTGRKNTSQSERDQFLQAVKGSIIPKTEVSPDAQAPTAVQGEVIQSPVQVPAGATQPTGEQKGVIPNEGNQEGRQEGRSQGLLAPPAPQTEGPATTEAPVIPIQEPANGKEGQEVKEPEAQAAPSPEAGAQAEAAPPGQAPASPAEARVEPPRGKPVDRPLSEYKMGELHTLAKELGVKGTVGRKRSVVEGMIEEARGKFVGGVDEVGAGEQPGVLSGLERDVHHDWNAVAKMVLDAPGVSEIYRALYELIKGMVSKNLRVVVQTTLTDSQGRPADSQYGGRFDADTGTVYVASRHATKPNRAAHILFHEILHATFDSKIRSDKSARETLEWILRHARRKQYGMGDDGPSLYGLNGDVYEFVNEAFTSRKMQEFLKNTYPNAKNYSSMGTVSGSLFSKFVDVVRRVLGISGKRKNALEMVIETTGSLFDAPMGGIAEDPNTGVVDSAPSATDGDFGLDPEDDLFVRTDDTDSAVDRRGLSGIYKEAGAEETASSTPSGAAMAPTRWEGDPPPEGDPTPLADRPEPVVNLELPELVQFTDQVMKGRRPKVASNLIARMKKTLGFFAATEGRADTAGITLRSDIFIGPEVTSGTIAQKKAEQLGQDLLEKVMSDTGLPEDQFRLKIDKLKNGKARVAVYRIDPTYAGKVLAHEIGHLADFIGGETLRRGGLLNRIAGVANVYKKFLPQTPKSPGELTPEERALLQEEAKRLAEADAEAKVDASIEKDLGVTPEAILAIWRSTEASKLPPDVLEFIKRLTPAEKKNLVKEALKGRVPAEVREVAGRIRNNYQRPTLKKILEKYNELVQAEIKKRQLFEYETINNELKDLTRWWSPFDEATASDGYKSYRFSSRELYAEALSVLLTNNEALQKRAPTFYRAWTNWLENKPTVKEAYEKVVRDIASGKSNERILAKILEGYERGDELWKKDVKAREEAQKKQSKNFFGEMLVDQFYAIKHLLAPIRRAGKGGPDETPVEYLIDEAIHSASEQEGFTRDLDRDIVKPLQKAGITDEEFGVFLEAYRVINERTEIANPEGMQPARAQELISGFKGKFGERGVKLMEQLQKKLMKLHRDYVVDKIVSSQVFSKPLTQKIDSNEAYVPFNVLPDEVQSEARANEPHGLQMFQQLGTLRSIKNPLTALLGRDLILMSALNWNKARRAAAEQIAKYAPNQISTAEFYRDSTGRKFFKEPADPSKGVLTYLKNGELEGFYVDKSIADSFSKKKGNGMLPRSMMMIYNLTEIIKALFTRWNVGFNTINLPRDVERTAINLPVRGKNVATRTVKPLYVVLRQIMKALPDIISSEYGAPTETIDAMMRGKMFISVADTSLMTKSDREFEYLMSRFVKDPKNWGLLRSAMDKVIRAAQLIERVPKVAAYKYLKEEFPEMSDAEIGFRIRRTGSPSFLTRGRASSVLGMLYLFINPQVQGFREDWDAIATEVAQKREASGKSSPFDWMTNDIAVRRMTYAIAPKLIKAALASGALIALAKYLGADDDDDTVQFLQKIKSMYDNVSDYYMTNYTVIPFGFDSEGKTVMLTLPQDETSRVVGGLFWKILNPQGRKQDAASVAQSAVAYAGEQGPSFNPALILAGSTMQMMTGNNPYDEFRQRQVIDKTEFEAGGWRRWKPFFEYALNTSGLLSPIHRFSGDPVNEAKSEIEKATKSPFVSATLGRWIRVTDSGKREILRTEAEEVRQQEANVLLDWQDAKIKELKGEPLTDLDKAALADPRNKRRDDDALRTKIYGNVYQRAIDQAGSTAQRDAITMKIFGIEKHNKEFRMAPLVQDDIRSKIKVLINEESTDLERAEARKWLSAREIRRNEAIDAFEPEIKKLKSPEGRVEKRRRVYRVLTGF